MPVGLSVTGKFAKFTIWTCIIKGYLYKQIDEKNICSSLYLASLTKYSRYLSQSNNSSQDTKKVCQHIPSQSDFDNIV